MRGIGGMVKKGQIPYVRIALPYVVGIILGNSLPVVPGVFKFASTALLCLGLLLAISVFYRVNSLSGRCFTSFFSLFLFVLGYVGIQAEDPRVKELHFSNHSDAFLIGTIVDEPHYTEKRVRFLLRVSAGVGNAFHTDSSRKRAGELQVSVQNPNVSSTDLQMPDLRYGDRLLIPANFRVVPPPLNPGELDYAAHLAKKNCWHQSYLQQDDIHVLSKDRGNPLLAHALNLRENLVAKFNASMKSAEAISIASTLILGYRAELSQELFQIYSGTGTIHVLSVSGMHVVIVFWLLSYLFSWMDRSRLLKIAKFFLLLISIWAYAMVTGFSPSVLRAAIMLSFVILAREVGKQAQIYNSIASSAFLLLLFEPKFLLEIGFQLSYLAVLFIVYLQAGLKQLIKTSNKWLRPVVDYSLMSIAAQAGAFPLATYYFNQFPIYFLLANLIIVLPATAIMYLGFALLFCPAGRLAQIIGWGLEELILLMNFSLRAVMNLPYASLTGLNYSWGFCIALYCCMISLSLSYYLKSRIYFRLTLIIIGFVVVSRNFEKWASNQRTEIVIHNVRDKMAVSIKDKKQVVLFRDFGEESQSTFQYSVYPYLKAQTDEKEVAFVEEQGDYFAKNVYISEGILQIGNARLVVLDGNREHYHAILPCDLLLIRNNPSVSATEIVQRHPQARVIVLDGSNSWRTVNRLASTLDSLEVETYILKDNYAYFWKFRQNKNLYRKGS